MASRHSGWMILVGVLLAPGLASAGGFGRTKGSGSSSSDSSSSSSSSTHSASPVGTGGEAHGSSSSESSAPARSHGYYSPGYSRGRAYYNPGYYGWGIHPWGYYGWGYYPYYGGPMIAQQVAMQPQDITSSVYLGGLFTGSGAGFDLNMRSEGKRLGVDFRLTTLPSVNPDDSNDVQAMPLLSAHLTYAVLADLHGRLRLEGGGTLISAPGVTYVGPDVGVSGQIALVGPLAVEAGVHWSPVPASVIDVEAGLALNFGNLSVRGGWRELRLDDTRINDEGGGVDLLGGPQVSIGLLF